MAVTDEVLTISARSAALWSRCPRRYKLEMVDKKRPQSNGDTCLAEALQVACRASLEGADQDKALATFEQSFVEGVTMADRWRGRDLSAYLAEGKRFVCQFHRNEVPCIQVQGLYKTYSKRCRTYSYNPDYPRIPIEISGEIPIVEATSVGFLRLCRKELGPRAVEGDLEFTLSALAANTVNAWMLVFDRSRGQITRRTLMVRGQVAAWALEMARAAAEGVRDGQFAPTDPESYWCIYGHCLYWHWCRGDRSAAYE